MDDHRCLAEIIGEIEKETETPVTLDQQKLINQLAHKIDQSPSDKMEGDHILIRGCSQAINEFLVPAVVTLRIVRNCNLVRHEDCKTKNIENVKDTIKNLQPFIEKNRYKYLLLENIQLFPTIDFYEKDGLKDLMTGKRVGATPSPSTSITRPTNMRVVATLPTDVGPELPVDIERLFNIKIDLPTAKASIDGHGEVLDVDPPSLPTPLGQPEFKSIIDIPRPSPPLTKPQDLGKKKEGWIRIASHMKVSIATARRLTKGRRFQNKSVIQGGNIPGGVWAWSAALDYVTDNPKKL